MFRAMRRDKQLLAAEDSIAVMNRGAHGVLACVGDDDERAKAFMALVEKYAGDQPDQLNMRKPLDAREAT